MNNITELIVEAYENRASLTRSSVSAELIQAVQDALELLDNGDARVAEPTATGWVVNEWLKKAVLLSFILAENRVLESGDSKYYDKVAGKFDSFDDVRFQAGDTVLCRQPWFVMALISRPMSFSCQAMSILEPT